MKNYSVIVSIPQKIEVSANTPEEAERLVRNQLIQAGQVRSTEPLEIQVATEVE